MNKKLRDYKIIRTSKLVDWNPPMKDKWKDLRSIKKRKSKKSDNKSLLYQTLKLPIKTKQWLNSSETSNEILKLRNDQLNLLKDNMKEKFKTWRDSIKSTSKRKTVTFPRLKTSRPEFQKIIKGKLSNWNRCTKKNWKDSRPYPLSKRKSP